MPSIVGYDIGRYFGRQSPDVLARVERERTAGMRSQRDRAFCCVQLRHTDLAATYVKL